MRCEREKCPCGNAEIRDVQKITLGMRWSEKEKSFVPNVIVIPYCELAIAAIKRESDEWDEKNKPKGF